MDNPNTQAKLTEKTKKMSQQTTQKTRGESRCSQVSYRIEQNRIEYVYLSIKDAHDSQYNYMKITIFTLIGMIRLIGFNIQDIQIHVNIQFCNQ